MSIQTSKIDPGEKEKKSRVSLRTPKLPKVGSKLTQNQPTKSNQNQPKVNPKLTQSLLSLGSYSFHSFNLFCTAVFLVLMLQ